MIKKQTYEVYNLVFQPYIKEYKIGDYVFKRIQSYKESFNKLMHLVNSTGSEFPTKVQTWEHQITATVTWPKKEKKSKLEWYHKNATKLDDVLLLLSIFTWRNVFLKNRNKSENIAITQDHRIHWFWWQLCLSLDHEWAYKNNRTWEIVLDKDFWKRSLSIRNRINIWFEKSLNSVLNTISSRKWQKEYDWGYFLFLYKSAIQRHTIDSSFITCWTIWEHIFTIKNRNWLNEKSILQMSGDNKISFIINYYFLKNIDEKARKNIKKITQTRNRLIHFWKKTEQIRIKDMELFIRLTEQLMAIILWLRPSNAFNSFEEFDKFLKEESKKIKH